ncbi:2990_t:CDS:2 [Acaulospora colombiana]|uniref:2990_t:CDS:1 n=1 Tax=Acaulospora colombiana TaxID=27376 RepID=A0ACA9L301_9GLOM|nr:2990_t:CDS:2 [Acaulospora colombiana]
MEIDEQNTPAFTSSQIEDSPTISQTLKKIKNTYQGVISREWMSPVLPMLPSMVEVQEHLNKIDINITLPLMDDQYLTPAIKLLRTHFYFDKLPSTFIIEKESPDLGLILLPCLF